MQCMEASTANLVKQVLDWTNLVFGIGIFFGIVKRLNIAEHPGMTCMKAWCCCSCFICQVARHLEKEHDEVLVGEPVKTRAVKVAPKQETSAPPPQTFQLPTTATYPTMTAQPMMYSPIASQSAVQPMMYSPVASPQLAQPMAYMVQAQAPVVPTAAYAPMSYAPQQPVRYY